MLSANQIEDIKAQAYAGCGSDLSEVCKVYPLTIKEVIEMGYSNYKTYLSTLLLDEVAISQHIKEKTETPMIYINIPAFYIYAINRPPRGTRHLPSRPI